MSPLWFLFATLTVVGSLFYNVGMKLGTTRMSVFAFMLVLNATALLIQISNFVIARYGFKVDVAAGLTKRGLAYGVLVGIAVSLTDICYFIALRYGSPVPTQTFWTIGSMIALTIFSVFFFRDAVTLPKACGVVLGIVAMFLITR